MIENYPSSQIKTFLKHLTTAPGVYRMLDATGEVLYVGKAFNLKKRVTSYFNKSDLCAKTRALVSQIVSIEVSVARSETEALLLESSLIKSLRPKYNVLMRDDKSYPYIVVTQHHSFPRIDIVRLKKKPKKGIYFGPYPNATAVRETLNIIQKVFKIRNCSDTYFSGRKRPCLQYQIKRCTAPCVDYISKESYQQALNNAVQFLQGKSQKIIDELALQMDQAVASLSFEEAAMLRDQIKHLRIVQEQQGVARIRGDADVIAIDVQPGLACVQCVTVRNGEVLASTSFYPSVLKVDDDDVDVLWQQVFSAFIAHYYIDTPERIPGIIVTKHKVDDKLALQTMLGELRGKACKIQTHPREVKAEWYKFAQTNLHHAVESRLTSSKLMAARYQSLMEILHLESAITRMECFDISHTQGALTVASCVVFDANGPCKKAYRRFNINGINPGDDYAAMEQAITRRAKYWLEYKSYPDLLIIDGGKGQVAVANRVLAALNINQVTILGIAKGVQRKAGMERLIFPEIKQEITLPTDSSALHLLQHIRDESHRFAISAHRKKRDKAGLSSTLEEIPGVGSKRRQALLRRFGGIRELSKAPIAEIAKVTGISEELAKRVHEHFL